ncbi:RNA polymerase sigma factor [Portibacter lacus]|uniref:RNA polymerase sigma factor SigX n=1 Tax=Portibacter lacus TaxID=1099794 RepID=A0AA37SPQ5_9BACT|nr:sigma-70 family RNA polymerase sigma factor [Portibacter lacus]GLR17725.1 RNA polymerase sigma factor SigX [Portibacter lacus]
MSNISDASTDEVLVEKYLNTQRGAYFDILYKRYSAKVYARSISMLKDAELAQDAVQEIFIKVLTSISKFQGKSKFSSWLYSITYNYCIDLIRKNKKIKTVAMDKLGEIEDMHGDIDDKELMETKFEQLKVVLNEMPAQDKTILLMKYQDNMSIREIGELNGKSESATKMQIKRAKQKFMVLRTDLFPAEIY